MDPARNAAEQDPLSRLVVQPFQPPQPPMDASQLVQWLSVQARSMAGDLQHNVRALTVRASSPMLVSDGHDEVSSLRKQLRHQQQAHVKLQTMLQNHVLAIETFQSKWQIAGQEAHAFAFSMSPAFACAKKCASCLMQEPSRLSLCGRVEWRNEEEYYMFIAHSQRQPFVYRALYHPAATTMWAPTKSSKKVSASHCWPMQEL